MSMLLKDIAEKIGGRIIGNDAAEISRIANLQTANKDEISFLSDKKMHKYLAESKAGAVLVKEEDVLPDSGITFVVVPNPYVAFARVAQMFDTTPRACAPGIHPTAVVDPTAEIDETASVGAHAVIESGVKIGAGTQIGPNCFVGKNTVIGKNTKLWANVSVYHNCVIGDSCLFQSGCVIGSDGFGYANERGEWIKIPQLGRVVIGNRVEIGASTAVDRGAVDDTVIEDNVIIDNQVQIAHNDKIGYGTAIAGAAVLAGSVELGKYCIVGGTSVFDGHIKICDGVEILGQVGKNINKPGKYHSFLPVLEAEKWWKLFPKMYSVDRLAEKLKALEKIVQELRPSEKVDDATDSKDSSK